MRGFPGLCSSRLTLSDGGAKVTIADGSGWGTVVCPLALPESVVSPLPSPGPSRDRGGKSRGGLTRSGSGGRGDGMRDEGWKMLTSSDLLIKSGRVTVEAKVVAVGPEEASNRRMIGFGVAMPGCNIDTYLGGDSSVRVLLQWCLISRVSVT